jgi:quercetin dioxygenase-like cupin family protein
MVARTRVNGDGETKMSIRREKQEHVASAEQTFDIFGVRLQFLIAPEQSSGKISLYRGTLPPGVVIPVHSHPEPEVFYVLEGNLEVYQESGAQQGWSIARAGNVVAIPADVKHALRNTSSSPATTVLVTQDRLYAFFREIAKPVDGQPGTPPSPEELQQLFIVAAKYGYWMGSPEENGAIGINLGRIQ